MRSFPIIASAICLASTAALAQPNAVCQANAQPDRVPAICDSHNEFVGLSLGGNVLRLIHQNWWVLNYDSGGLSLGVQFLYGDAACATPPYLDTGGGSVSAGLFETLPQRASFDGQAIWGSNQSPTLVTVLATRQGSITAECDPLFQPTIRFARPASIIDSTPFFPPFRLQ